jgi:putative transcriptional regulator
MIKKQSRATEAILETAEGMYRSGMLNQAEYEKITVRLLGAQTLPKARPICGEEIRGLREKA